MNNSASTGQQEEEEMLSRMNIYVLCLPCRRDFMRDVLGSSSFRWQFLLWAITGFNLPNCMECCRFLNLIALIGSLEVENCEL